MLSHLFLTDTRIQRVEPVKRQYDAILEKFEESGRLRSAKG